VAPALRECFLKVESGLSAKNRETFDLAARTPFEHSYLANMLYRAWTADRAAALCVVLERFDHNYPSATMNQLMDAMMYRGHAFGGLEWGDRYLPKLMSAGNSLSDVDREAFIGARDWTIDFYRKTPATYGLTYTLREALEEKKLDCVRSTDMIDAIYRNAGRAGDRQRLVGAPARSAIRSPRCWMARTRCWPTGWICRPSRSAGPTPISTATPGPREWKTSRRRIPSSSIFAASTTTSGPTDTSSAGPNAGQLARAAVPYFPDRTSKSWSRAFEGPYPQ